MTKSMFRIGMLPAQQGDALWIEYGPRGSENRILIDGGPLPTYPQLRQRLDQLPDGDKRVELVVISHVDTDHINGILRLLAAKRSKWPIQPNDIWFNGWSHLGESATLGGREGDFLSALLFHRANEEWNRAFHHSAVMRAPDCPLPVVTLRGGLTLTILSPTPAKLHQLAAKWKKDVRKFQMTPGDLESAWRQLAETPEFHLSDTSLGGGSGTIDSVLRQLEVDPSAANGASIAFLAEYDGKSCLFLADAHMDVVCASIRTLLEKKGSRLRVDAVKVSHHGSKSNLSKEFLGLVDARNFLISTDGSIHSHPDKPVLSALIQSATHEPTIWFNYRSRQTIPWSKKHDVRGHPFATKYPEGEGGGITVEL